MKDITDKGHHVYTTMLEAATQAMNDASSEGRDITQVLYIGINAVAGALVPMAALMGFTPDKRKPVTDINAMESVNTTTMLVAALLAAKVAKIDVEHTMMDYGPHQIFKAIDAAQKVIGADPRSSLSKSMVKVADSFKPDDRLGNSWNVNNSPTLTEDERPRYLN